jgi:hypothetical protein
MKQSARGPKWRTADSPPPMPGKVSDFPLELWKLSVLAGCLERVISGHCCYISECPLCNRKHTSPKNIVNRRCPLRVKKPPWVEDAEADFSSYRSPSAYRKKRVGHSLRGIDRVRWRRAWSMPLDRHPSTSPTSTSRRIGAAWEIPPAQAVEPAQSGRDAGVCAASRALSPGCSTWWV